MPQNPRHMGLLSFLDYSNETSHFKFDFGPITALTIAAFLTQYGALRSATDAITIGALVEDTWKGDVTRYNVAKPSDPNAQRERKFLVTYQDTTSFSKYRLEIPTASFEVGSPAASVFKPNTDEVDLTVTEIAAWITAFETLCKSPEGNGVDVVEIRGVGRNL